MSEDRPEDPVDAFAGSCERLLGLCLTDARPEYVRIWALRSALGELVARVGSLPTSTEAYDVNDSPTKEDLYKRIARRYPSLGDYHELWHALAVDKDPECVIADVIDDLGDTCRELLCGLEHYNAGRRDDAVGHWLFSFHVHWGKHTLGALRALHQHVVDNGGWLPPADSRDANPPM